MEKGKNIKNGNVNFENLNSEGKREIYIKDVGNMSEEELVDRINEQLFIYNENWALNEAVKIANQSPCQSKRGVIIWNRYFGIVSSGYNNISKPFKCDGSDKCKANCAKTAVHAEQQALLNFTKQFENNRLTYSYNECEVLHVKSVDGKAVFSEKPSCWQCSKLILASGLKYMWLYTKDGLVKWTAEDFHRVTLENNNLL